MLRNAVEVGGGWWVVGGWWVGVSFPAKKRYEGVWFNIIGITRGVCGGQIPWKKTLYLTLE